MADPNRKSYRRLPGTGYRRIVPGWAIFLAFFVIGIFALLLRGRRVQLWQGDNHLLLVEWDGNKEYYKRYYFRDIQAFLVRRTVDGKIFNGIVGALTVLFCLPAFVVTDPGGRIALLVIGGLFGLILLGNILTGPTCACQLRTAVQIEDLPSLTRLAQARKVFTRLRPLIAAEQGELPPEEIPARMRALVEAPPATTQQFIVDDPNAPPRIL